jgi:hypothetical protein
MRQRYLSLLRSPVSAVRFDHGPSHSIDPGRAVGKIQPGALLQRLQLEKTADVALGVGCVSETAQTETVKEKASKTGDRKSMPCGSVLTEKYYFLLHNR